MKNQKRYQNQKCVKIDKKLEVTLPQEYNKLFVGSRMNYNQKKTRNHKIYGAKQNRIVVFATMLVLALLLTGCGKIQENKNGAAEEGLQSESPGTEKIGTKSDSLPSQMAETKSLTESNQLLPDGFEETQENNKAFRAFQEFIEGTKGILLEDEAVPLYFQMDGELMELDTDKEYYLVELLDMVTKSYFQYFEDRTKIGALEYAYLDLGADGVLDMAVRFKGLNIYSENDDSSLVFIIVYENEKLYMRCSYETWARSEGTLYYNGYKLCNGSGGAGDHILEESLITVQGRAEIISFQEILSAWWCRDISPQAYDEVWGDEASDNLEVKVFHIDGNVLICCEAGEDEKIARFISLCEQQGIVFSTQEEVNKQIEMRKTELGLDDKEMIQRECSWQKVEASSYSDFIEEI